MLGTIIIDALLAPPGLVNAMGARTPDHSCLPADEFHRLSFKWQDRGEGELAWHAAANRGPR